MQLTVRQLETLLAVADHGSFSAAADALGTVQSNVSAHLAKLEAELGAPLVDRRTGLLTAAGETVAARARRVLAEVAALSGDVASLGAAVAGQVRLGVIGTAARWLVPLLLESLGHSHPRVDLVVIEATTTSLEPQVVAGTLDAAVVNLSALRRPAAQLLSEPLFDEDLVLVVPGGHPLAARSAVELADLDGLEVLLPPAGTAYRADLDAAARAAGVALRPRAEIDGLRLIASLVMDGHGPAVLPTTAIPPWLTGAWRKLDVAGLPRRSVGIARRRRAALSPAADAVLAELRAVTAARAVAGVEPAPRAATTARR